MAVEAPHFTDIVQGDAGYIGAAKYGDFAISVFSDNKCMDAAAVYAQMLAELAFEAPAVQYGSGADDTVLGKAGGFQRRSAGFPRTHVP